jgi:hypothetical protein
MRGVGSSFSAYAALLPIHPRAHRACQAEAGWKSKLLLSVPLTSVPKLVSYSSLGDLQHGPVLQPAARGPTPGQWVDRVIALNIALNPCSSCSQGFCSCSCHMLDVIYIIEAQGAAREGGAVVQQRGNFNQIRQLFTNTHLKSNK